MNKSHHNKPLLQGGIIKTRTLAEAERHDLPEKSFRVSIEFALGGLLNLDAEGVTR